MMHRMGLRLREASGEMAHDEPSATFEGFFDAERDRLFRMLCVVTGSRHEAEELSQEAFLRVWQRWSEVRRMDEPEGYLHRTAMNLFRKRYRRASMALRTTVGLAAPQDVFEQVDDRDTIAHALRSLTPRQRAAMVLTEMLGYSPEEAGSSPGDQGVDGAGSELPGAIRTSRRTGGSGCLVRGTRQSSFGSAIEDRMGRIRPPSYSFDDLAKRRGRKQRNSRIRFRGRRARPVGCRARDPTERRRTRRPGRAARHAEHRANERGSPAPGVDRVVAVARVHAAGRRGRPSLRRLRRRDREGISFVLRASPVQADLVRVDDLDVPQSAHRLRWRRVCRRGGDDGAGGSVGLRRRLRIRRGDVPTALDGRGAGERPTQVCRRGRAARHARRGRHPGLRAPGPRRRAHRFPSDVCHADVWATLARAARVT